MRTLLLVAALFISIHSHSMAQSFTRSIGNTKDELIFHGQVTFADLEKETSFKWFAEGAATYKPDAEDITFLKKELKKYTMVVLMGTWCEDSHNMVPKLYRVLRDVDYLANKFVMYGLDRKKQGTKNEEAKYRVTSVPTVILFSGEEEIGRITELVQKSVEADLVAIIKDYQEE